MGVAKGSTGRAPAGMRKLGVWAGHARPPLAQISTQARGSPYEGGDGGVEAPRTSRDAAHFNESAKRGLEAPTDGMCKPDSIGRYA
jgi:hypothetical protein